ncbi:MAG: hypothetical protein ABI534_11085 [Chloroflexota bacterium]
MERGPAVAVGRLSAGGPWVGFAADEGGYALAFGEGSTERRGPSGATVRHDLLCAALVYFDDGEAPPDELQATHGDVADLVRWLAATAPDDVTRPLLLAALDAIDDGLATDAVMLCLEAAAASTPRTASEQADPIDLLAERYRDLTR